MSGPAKAPLSGGRWHFQHGPIDLVLFAEGAPADVSRAYEAAWERFRIILDELVAELPLLRSPAGQGAAMPSGSVARVMARAVRPFARHGFITPMAAVAGAVAEAVLAATTEAAPLERAYVNDGGDIALYLTGSARFRTMIADHCGRPLGAIAIGAGDPVRGIATSGRHGRSHSLGIADSVTVLAASAAVADAAATMVANAVDLPGHPAISRAPACILSPDSDLGERLVVTGCGPLTAGERGRALEAGERYAERLVAEGLIVAAFLHLQDETRICGETGRKACRESRETGRDGLEIARESAGVSVFSGRELASR